VCGQPDVGREHKPKREITHEWNIDEHCNQRKESNNKGYYVHAENVENANSRNRHITDLLKASRESLLGLFLNNRKE
jgi:hypothetical protein